MLNVLAMLVDLEPKQAELLDRICDGPLISEDDLKTAGAFDLEVSKPRRTKNPRPTTLFEQSLAPAGNDRQPKKYGWHTRCKE